MREISAIIKDSILDLQSFIYCFEIRLTEGKELFLNSSDRIIKSTNADYLPDSGLSLKEGIFNDCGQDYITLQGIFEATGIDKQVDLTRATFKILIYFESHLYNFVTYSCMAYTKYDLDFVVHLQPETTKYNQTLLNVYSRTCRTNFGDSKCKVDKNAYSGSYEISKIDNRTIKVVNINKDSGYYIGGEAILADNKFAAKILNSYKDTVELDRAIPECYRNIGHVIFVAGCDKKFITCCNKFNNAVNFRGEPLIPEYNFLSII